MMLSPHDHFSRPANIAEGKRGRLKDVNVSKTINMIGELPLLCYYKEECFELNGKKIVPYCFAGIVIARK